MISEKSRVKIYFRNGLTLDGHVISWSDTKSVIETPSNDKIVIQKTNDDVMAVRIYSDQKQPDVDKVRQVYIDEELKLDEPISEPNLRAKKLAELYDLRGREERRRAHELLTTKQLSTICPVTYGIPSKL